MSNFVFILRNLVGSGMTNTESALIVLESFFQSEGNELRNNAISCRSEIADLKKDLTENTKSEEQTEIAFTKIKLRVLFLIDEVEKTSFDDEWAINYFAMLDPNPAYDPFFSPLKKPEKMPEDIIIPEEALIELPLESTKSKTNWSKRLLPIGGVLIGGLLLSNVLGYSPFSNHDDNNGYVSTSQAAPNANNIVPQQNKNDTQTSSMTLGNRLLIERNIQVKQHNKIPPTTPPIQPPKIPSPQQKVISNPETEFEVSTPRPTPTPIVKPNPTPIIKPNPTPVIKPNPEPVVKPSPKPAVKPSPKPIEPKPTKPKVPEIKPPTANKKQEIYNLQDSLKKIYLRISKMQEDSAKSSILISQLKNDSKNIAKLTTEQNRYKKLIIELAILKSKKAKILNITR